MFPAWIHCILWKGMMLVLVLLPGVLMTVISSPAQLTEQPVCGISRQVNFPGLCHIRVANLIKRLVNVSKYTDTMNRSLAAPGLLTATHLSRDVCQKTGVCASGVWMVSSSMTGAAHTEFKTSLYPVTAIAWWPWITMAVYIIITL